MILKEKVKDQEYSRKKKKENKNTEEPQSGGKKELTKQINAQ